MAVLDSHLLAGDVGVRDVILGSFLYNLEDNDAAYQPIRAPLGHSLPQALEEMESWHPTDLDSPT